MFGGSLGYLTQTAYASAGVPWRVHQRNGPHAILERSDSCPEAGRHNGHDDLGIAQPPDDLLRQVQADVTRAGGELAARS